MKKESVFLSVASLMTMVILLNSCTGTPTYPATTDSITGSVDETRVAIVPPGFDSPFHLAIKDGAVSEAHKLGWQVAMVKQELQKDVDAIAINPIDVEAIVTAVK